MQKIIPDPEFKAVNRALTPEEYAALRDKIRAEGPKEPLWVGSGRSPRHCSTAILGKTATGSPPARRRARRGLHRSRR